MLHFVKAIRGHMSFNFGVSFVLVCMDCVSPLEMLRGAARVGHVIFSRFKKCWIYAMLSEVLTSLDDHKA